VFIAGEVDVRPQCAPTIEAHRAFSLLSRPDRGRDFLVASSPLRICRRLRSIAPGLDNSAPVGLTTIPVGEGDAPLGVPSVGATIVSPTSSNIPQADEAATTAKSGG
jgi:hypothetical protein